MNTDDKKFLNIAIELAEENARSGNGGPFGAVIVKDGKVIATGVNSVSTNHDPTAHAEIIAIRNACKNLKDFQLSECDLYSSCEPCPMCLGAIYWARPRRLIFASDRKDAKEAGFDDLFIYKEVCMDFQLRSIPTEHLPIKTRNAPFEAWKNNTDRIDY
ncbi:MAG: nucleoside deaminase [Spirochaetes bacterium]|nr:nucleoside deaminase [Spirochaetota bacterium]